MKKSAVKILSLIMAIVLAIGCLASCGGAKKNYAENNTEIKICASGPLTGGAAVYGIAVRNSAQLAINEINALEAAGGEGTLGVQFKFEMYNDEHNPDNINTAYSNLYEGGMQISLGTVTTKPGLEFKPLSKDDNVFVLTPSASGDAIPEYDNAFQMCFADSNQGTASAEYFNQNYEGKKVGIFYKSDDEYSVGIYNKFKEALDESFETVAEASFKGEEADFAQQVQSLKDCDVIFMPIYYTPASQFMLKGVGQVKDTAVYFGCDGLDGIDSVKNEATGEPVINAVPQEISYLSHFNSGATEGAAADFIAKYNATYDSAKEPLNQFGAAAYDCVYAIYEALKVAKANGKEFDATTAPSVFCDILTEVFTSDSFVFHGVTGEAKADGKSDISWTDEGFVNKQAVKYIVKSASN